MDKPVQWMTLDELRAELHRTQAASEADHADLNSFVESGELPETSPAARRHQLVADELARRASLDP